MYIGIVRAIAVIECRCHWIQLTRTRKRKCVHYIRLCFFLRSQTF